MVCKRKTNKFICIPKKCTINKKYKRKRSCGYKSTIRAIAGTNQPIPAGLSSFSQMKFDTQESDLNNENNSLTSTSHSKSTGGGYTFTASFNFEPNATATITMGITIRVNGSQD